MTGETSNLEPVQECPNCGRRVAKLFKLSAEDIQRAHSPEEVGVYLNVCGDCREKFRTAARLESSYKARAAFRDLLLMVPVFFVTFSLITRVFSGYAFLISVVIFFTAGINALKGISNRYAFTHNLVWSLKSRPILALVSAAISILLVALVRF